MDDALHMHADVGVLEVFDTQAAAMAMRKERERVARDLVENRIVVSAGQRHQRSLTRRCAAERTVCCLRAIY